jgi:hypothetical protein
VAAFDPSQFSSDQATALKQFKSQFGRAPNSSEVAAWQSRNAPARSASSPAAPAAEKSIVQEGFGGQSQWDVVQQNAMGPADISTTTGNDAIAFGDAAIPDELVATHLGTLKDSIDRLSSSNASMLRGEIPADVSSAVRRAASESAIAGGIFGAAGRGLSARDLGRTSMDIKQQGFQNESSLLESRNQLAASYESIRQYNLNRNTELAKLSLAAKQQNLSAIEQERMRIATNIEANVNILGQIAQLAINQQSIASQAAANKIDPSNIISSLDNMIAQFTAQLS